MKRILRVPRVFRRLEEEYLLTPSQLVYRVGHGSWGAAYLTQGDGWITAGKVTTLDGGGTPFFHYDGVITHVLPQDSMQVVILPLSTEEGSTVVALWGAPEEAATGELELTLEGIEPWSDILDGRCRSGRCFPPRPSGRGTGSSLNCRPTRTTRTLSGALWMPCGTTCRLWRGPVPGPTASPSGTPGGMWCGLGPGTQRREMPACGPDGERT